MIAGPSFEQALKIRVALTSEDLMLIGAEGGLSVVIDVFLLRVQKIEGKR